MAAVERGGTMTTTRGQEITSDGMGKSFLRTTHEAKPVAGTTEEAARPKASMLRARSGLTRGFVHGHPATMRGEKGCHESLYVRSPQYIGVFAYI
jgi:hypothetical protein